MDTAIAALKPPRINTVWPGQGGIYAGIAAGLDGQPDCHVILARVEGTDLSWPAATAWAKTLAVDGHTDFALPTRFQSVLLYANVHGVINTTEWHWTSTEASERSAWIQNFYRGTQSGHGKSYEARARAVRLIPISL